MSERISLKLNMIKILPIKGLRRGFTIDMPFINFSNSFDGDGFFQRLDGGVEFKDEVVHVKIEHKEGTIDQLVVKSLLFDGQSPNQLEVDTYSSVYGRVSAKKENGLSYLSPIPRSFETTITEIPVTSSGFAVQDPVMYALSYSNNESSEFNLGYFGNDPVYVSEARENVDLFVQEKATDFFTQIPFEGTNNYFSNDNNYTATEETFVGKLPQVTNYTNHKPLEFDRDQKKPNFNEYKLGLQLKINHTPKVGQLNVDYSKPKLDHVEFSGRVPANLEFNGEREDYTPPTVQNSNFINLEAINQGEVNVNLEVKTNYTNNLITNYDRDPKKPNFNEYKLKVGNDVKVAREVVESTLPSFEPTKLQLYQPDSNTDIEIVSSKIDNNIPSFEVNLDRSYDVLTSRVSFPEINSDIEFNNAETSINSNSTEREVVEVKNEGFVSNTSQENYQIASKVEEVMSLTISQYDVNVLKMDHKLNTNFSSDNYQLSGDVVELSQIRDSNLTIIVIPSDYQIELKSDSVFESREEVESRVVNNSSINYKNEHVSETFNYSRNDLVSDNSSMTEVEVKSENYSNVENISASNYTDSSLESVVEQSSEVAPVLKIRKRENKQENLKPNQGYENKNSEFKFLDFAQKRVESIDNNVYADQCSTKLDSDYVLDSEGKKVDYITHMKRADLCSTKLDSDLLKIEEGISVFNLNFKDQLDNYNSNVKRTVAIKVGNKTEYREFDGNSVISMLDALAEGNNYEFFIEETENGLMLRDISGHEDQFYNIKVVDKQGNTLRYIKSSIDLEKIDTRYERLGIEYGSLNESIDDYVFSNDLKKIYSAGNEVEGVREVYSFDGERKFSFGSTKLDAKDTDGNDVQYKVKNGSIMDVVVKTLQQEGYQVELEKQTVKKDGKIIGEGIIIKNLYKDGEKVVATSKKVGLMIETVDQYGFVGEPINASGNLLPLDKAKVQDGMTYRVVLSQQGIYDRNDINKDLQRAA